MFDRGAIHAEVTLCLGREDGAKRVTDGYSLPIQSSNRVGNITGLRSISNDWEMTTKVE